MIARAAIALVFAVASCRDREPPQPTGDAHAAPTSSTSAPLGEPPRREAEGAWCTDGWSELGAGPCFFVPAGLASPTTLLVFLHGVMSPEATPVDHQALVRRVAEAHGAVALFPRGRPGLCTWNPKLATSSCWPTKRETVDESGAAIVGEWEMAANAVAARLGLSFERRYVVGFSNGGYFAAYVGLEGLWRNDGVAVVGAGRSVVDDARAAHRSPFYLAVGDQEVPDTILSAEKLAAYLWSRRTVARLWVHPTRNHEIREDDFHAAWEVWAEGDKSAEDFE